MTVRSGSTPQDNAVELLLAQHDEIRHLLAEVGQAAPEDRQESFTRLVRMLAVHETAEEEVVHPRMRHSVPDGWRVVDARLEEERQAKQALSELETDGVRAGDFARRFELLREAVEAHAEAEEREEFPLLREYAADKMKSMARQVRAAEALAPTHPHPRTESRTANLTLGPFAAVSDRVRDLVRHAARR